MLLWPSQQHLPLAWRLDWPRQWHNCKEFSHTNWLFALSATCAGLFGSRGWLHLRSNRPAGQVRTNRSCWTLPKTWHLWWGRFDRNAIVWRTTNHADLTQKIYRSKKKHRIRWHTKNTCFFLIKQHFSRIFSIFFLAGGGKRGELSRNKCNCLDFFLFVLSPKVENTQTQFFGVKR